MMIMGTSGHSLFGFLLSCLALAFLRLVRAQDQSGFISLDCGLPEGTNYTEKTTKINYVSDASFINTGVGRSVDSAYGDLDIYEMQLKKLRSFPDGIRNCYNISIKRATEYLIRASFLYGNYDGLDSPPMFDIYIGNSLWETLNVTGNGMGVFIELIHVTSSDEVHICLINTGNGVPFISALEFRPSPNITYYTPSASLSVFDRLDFGSTDGQTYRFPLDVYDRIWSTFNSKDWTRVSTNITVDVSGGKALHLPSIVMNTASTAKDASTTLEISWDTIDSSRYFVLMHFAELVIPQVNQSREFNVWHNAHFYSGTVIPKYLSSMTLLSRQPLEAASSHLLSFIPTENSTLPPLINAFELYGMKEISELETEQGDVDAITNIRSNYGIKKDWQGDPCVPMEYAWSGLNCSNKTAPRIISLDLSGSGLIGEISSYISNLTMLQILDLSNNGLTGEIPEFLVNLPNLRILSLTRNSFTGLIPKALLQRAEAGLLTLSVGENPDLCTSLKCDNKKKKKRNKYLVPVILASVIAVFLPILIITLVIYKRRRQRENLKRSIQERLLKSKNQQVHYSEILVITDNFKTTLGEGGFGKVYLGVLSDKTQVAVKLLSSISQQGYNEFRAEAQILTVVHHRNLVSLVGYCDEAENKALIYEFMCNGNLGNHLSDSSAKVLSWMERLQIAVDAAQGLEYLHNGCVPPIIHRDIKSSNILLNEKMQAKISDFGLSRVFANENDTHFSTCPAGTFGYVDPTVHLSRNFIKKSDVYSFGIILLELITGHPAIIKSSEVNTHIVDWVKPLISEGNIENIVDPRLEGSIESCSARKFVELALSCTLPTSAGRPDMSDVVLQLIECLEIVQDRAQIPPNNAENFSHNSIGSVSIVGPRIPQAHAATTEKKMGAFMWFVCAIFLALPSSEAAQEPTAAATIFPAILTFGDSALDVGNNNNRFTLFKANYHPYGRDFMNHKATGRFCNGKLVSDITAENLGFESHPPAYLSPEASGRNLLIGACFASAAAGYDEQASISNRAITLAQQLSNYKEYQSKVAMVAGREKAAAIVKDGLHILSCGTSDYLQNYYTNPAVRRRFTPDQYSSFLVASFSKFIKDLHGLGARKIGVTSMPPLGCFPAVLTLFGYQQQKGCVRTINNHVLVFNRKLNSTAATLRKQLPDLKLVVFDVFNPLYNAIMSPSSYGFDEVRRGCCGTGAVETASVLCNPKSHVTCSNATKYMFWDSVHPSQAANQILADAMLVQGYALI
ncbi:putative leucine-rich repeat receptor-like protein kinase At2g19210 [Cucurbita moschata]|uniref:Leucine-rich repeat receptor-like protein kinase At2g19210 n=1 Tax=Cucurbita moschata TaxID=3662 RepID=A0A6J1HGV0_CUCMO|nr:putative leucine-rich repeat receptor-like protein kinase At2g19210 [Cucurbita moschata]